MSTGTSATVRALHSTLSFSDCVLCFCWSCYSHAYRCSVVRMFVEREFISFINKVDEKKWIKNKRKLELLKGPELCPQGRAPLSGRCAAPWKKQQRKLKAVLKCAHKGKHPSCPDVAPHHHEGEDRYRTATSFSYLHKT